MGNKLFGVYFILKTLQIFHLSQSAGDNQQILVYYLFQQEKVVQWFSEEIGRMILTAKRKMSEGKENGRSALSQRELEVLGRIKDGMRTTDISEALGISERTVKFHIKNIKQKLSAVSRAHAVAIALERKLIDTVKHA